MKKMKIMKKLLILGFAGILGFSAVACGGESNDDNGGATTTPQGTVSERLSTPYTGGLHKHNVQPTNNPFVLNGKSDYTVIYDSTSAEASRWAGFIVGQVKAATGVSLGSKAYNESFNEAFSSDKKWIVVGAPELFEEAGLQMPTEKLKQTGFCIKTQGNSVFIATAHNMGYQGGVLTFLHYTIGYACYGEDTIKYHKDGTTMPIFDVVDNPDVEYRYRMAAGGREPSTYMGFIPNGMDDVWILTDGINGHNSYKFVPFELKAEHPEYFTKKADSQGNFDLCYSAGCLPEHMSEDGSNPRGEGSTYQAMQDLAFGNAIRFIDESNTYAKSIKLAIQDGHSVCDCAACTVIYEEYDTHSAAYIMFLNDLADRIAEYYEGKREVKLAFLAYNAMDIAPVKEVNGRWEPVDEHVMLSENLEVDYAPISIEYAASIYDEVNEASLEYFEQWAAMMKTGAGIHIWMYQTNFFEYLYPYGTWSTMQEYYRFWVENGAISMLAQSQHNQTGTSTAFHKFKDYLDSKMLWNINENYAELKDEFFTNYYGAAKEPMLNFFHEVEAHLTYLETAYPSELGTCYEDIAKSEYWPLQLLNRWNGYVEEAYKAIEIYKNSDPELYKVLYNHVLAESIFPRYAILTLHSGMFSDVAFKTMTTSFKADCATLGITKWGEPEARRLSNIYSQWGIA